MRTSHNIKIGAVEESILAAKKKKTSQDYFLQKILGSDFYLICDEKVLSSSETILPLCVEIDSQKYVCVFTNKDWANQYFKKEVAIIKLLAKEVLKFIPESYGLIINPNYDASVKFNASGICNIVRDFC